MNDRHLDEACDSVDACVFTGDALEDPVNREALRQYLERWQRGLAEHEDNPMGDCYEANAKWLQMHNEPGWRLVHGIALGQRPNRGGAPRPLLAGV